MKKSYIAPKTKNINIMFEGLVATSNQLNDGSDIGNGYNPDDVSGSNRRSIWDSEY